MPACVVGAPGKTSFLKQDDKAMILPTHLRYMLTSNMTNRLSIYDCITSGFMGYFCSRNSTRFHIELLISCSQSWLQGSYNYQHFIVGETGPREEKQDVLRNKSSPRSLLTCPTVKIIFKKN